MARICVSGWEMSNSNGSDGGIWPSATNFAYAAQPFSGNGAGRAWAASAGVRSIVRDVFASGYQGNLYAQIRVRTDTATNGTMLQFYDAAAAGISFGLRQADVSGSKYFRLYDNSVQLGSDWGPITLTQWYLIEFVYTYATGVVSTYFDMVAGPSGTVNATYNNPSRVYIGWTGSQTGDIYYDDFILDDAVRPTTGTVNGGRIVQLGPAANGTLDSGESAGTRGGTDTGSNFSQLTDNPPDDSTTYMILDVAAEAVPVTLQDTGGLSGNEIRCVAVNARHMPSSGGTMGFRRKIRGSSGTWAALDVADVQHNDTSWKTNGDTTYGTQPPAFSLTDPDTSAAWTASGLDAAEISVRAYDASPPVWVTALWANVEYYEPAVSVGRARIGSGMMGGPKARQMDATALGG